MNHIGGGQDIVLPKPTDHFTLHFIELQDTPPFDGFPEQAPVHIEVRVAGERAGHMHMHEIEWATIWRALIRATPELERVGVSLIRTGPFR